MKIGILQTGHSPEGLVAEFGSYANMFADRLDGFGFSFERHVVVDDAFPQSAHDADGWLITGSKFGAYEDLPWIHRLQALVRQIHNARIPLVGICFGHQIIAQALGGQVEKYRHGWAVGATTYRSLTGDKDFTLNAWHQDQVTKRPADARLLATSDFCENAALAYGDHTISMQPHPEMSAEFLHGLIEDRGRGLVPDAILEDALAKLGTPLAADETFRDIANFFHRHKKAGGPDAR